MKRSRKEAHEASPAWPAAEGGRLSDRPRIERPRAAAALRTICLALAAAVAAALAGGAKGQPLDEPIKPIPTVTREDPSRVAIGRRLFTDVRLSANDQVSCASCHDLGRGGSNGKPFSVGFRGNATTVNVPTLFNASFNFRQFWNGRAETLEAQIDEVVHNSTEMGSDWSDVVRKVGADPAYRAAFAAAYPEGVSRTSIAGALAAFERTLVTPNSRFDRYLRGDASAIDATERSGYEKFKRYGCIACHQGVNVGGNMFQKFGVMGDYFAARGHAGEADLGRYLVTHDERDRHVFKVPGLRNVELTAPYFHDGSAATLEAAVAIMFRYQLGRIATPGDTQAIVAFLKTLTGERPSWP